MNFTRDFMTNWTGKLFLFGAVAAIASLVTLHFRPQPVAADDGPALIAQANPMKKPKPEPPKPKTTVPKKPAVDAKQPEDVEAEEGPAKAAPVVEYEKVKLADGMEIEVEKWGDTFEAYDYRPPVELDDPRVEEIAWFKNLGSGGPDGMQVDSKGGKLYFAWSLGEKYATGKIVRCNLDGSQMTYLVEGLRRPRDIVLDIEHNRMYWLEGTQDKQSLKTANLDGKEVKALIEGMHGPFGLALDAKRGELYYWEDPGRIIRVNTDGAGERLFIGVSQDPYLGAAPRGLYWNQKEDKLFWVCFGGQTRCAGNNAAVQALFDARLPNYAHVAFEATRSQVAFLDKTGGLLIRANLDGTEREVLVMSNANTKQENRKSVGLSVAVDEPRGTIFWSGIHYDGTNPFSTIWRMKLPPRLKRVQKPSPPLITAITPFTIKRDEKLSVHGQHLSSTKAVTFVDDSTHEHVPAEFETVDEDSISIVVPKLSDGCKHPLLIVETPSGVTMTLRKDLKVIRSEDRYVHDRLKYGQLPQLWVLPNPGTEGRPSSGAIEVESACAYVGYGNVFAAGGHGLNTVFAKNGAFAGSAGRRGVFYHEPFVRIGRTNETDPSMTSHSVSAIRPSFLDAVLTYRN